MRLSLLVLALLGTTNLCAQTPDPLDPRGYFPLSVGNEWEYRVDISGPVGTFRNEYVRYRIVSDNAGPTADRFAIVNERYKDLATLQTRDTVAVRYDVSRMTVLGFYPDSQGNPYEAPFPYYACDLGLPFDGGGGACWSSAMQTQIMIPLLTGETMPVQAKRFNSFLNRFDAVHGIGFVSGFIGCDPCGPGSQQVELELIYARVDGQTYGTKAVSSTPGPTSSLSTLHAYPNPTAGPLHLRLDSSKTTPIEFQIYNALGRIVLSSSLPSSGGVVDLGGLASGPYAVRANGQTVLIVVR